MKREKTREIKYLHDSEVQKILGKIKDVRDKAIFTLMYYRGLRASEVGMIEMNDVRLNVGRIYIRRLKGSISAEYLLSPPEVKVLKTWIELRNSSLWSEKGLIYKKESRDATKILFPSLRGGPIDRRTLYALFRWYGEAAGIETNRLFPHTLKHSIATHLLDLGEDLTTVKDWLGHKSINSTEIYGQITNKRRDDTAKRVFGKL